MIEVKVESRELVQAVKVFEQVVGTTPKMKMEGTVVCLSHRLRTKTKEQELQEKLTKRLQDSITTETELQLFREYCWGKIFAIEELSGLARANGFSLVAQVLEGYKDKWEALSKVTSLFEVEIPEKPSKQDRALLWDLVKPWIGGK